MRGVGRRAVVDGVTLAYDEYGSSSTPPVVLLHALGESRRDWADIAGRLAQQFRVIAVDLRGHGDSARPGAYATALMADDVAGLLDQLGLDHVILVGHSLGGVVAYEVAERRPDLVTRLVAEDVTPPFARDRPMPDRPDTELDFDWDAVVALRREAEQDDPAGWAALGSIQAPTLLVGGGPDSPVPAERLHAVVDLVPDCELVEIPAGHYVHRNRPEDFLDAVVGWLSRTSPR